MVATSGRRSVLLLKAPDAKYADAFRSIEAANADVSFDVHFAEVLTFEYVNTDALRKILLHLVDHSALLVSSPRAGIAIRNMVEALDGLQREEVITALRNTPVFSVGKATSRELECYGVQCLGDDCGSADTLAPYIHQEGILPLSASTKPVTFLCGDKRSDILPQSFHQRQLPFKELAVYRTCTVKDFQLPVTCEKPNWVVYFSPSGIKATRSVEAPWKEVNKAAIGKTTATALEKLVEETGETSWAADVVSPKPTAESLAQAITDFELAASR